MKLSVATIAIVGTAAIATVHGAAVDTTNAQPEFANDLYDYDAPVGHASNNRLATRNFPGAWGGGWGWRGGFWPGGGWGWRGGFWPGGGWRGGWGGWRGGWG
ncbi:hypothetical protein GGF37_006527, partial [Kickxella alabastrina]